MVAELQPRWKERIIKNELMRLKISINILTEARDSQSRYKESLWDWLENKYNTKLRIVSWNVSSIKKGTFEEMNNCLAHIICL